MGHHQVVPYIAPWDGGPEGWLLVATALDSRAVGEPTTSRFSLLFLGCSLCPPVIRHRLGEVWRRPWSGLGGEAVVWPFPGSHLPG